MNALVQAMPRALWMTSLQEHCGVSPHYKRVPYHTGHYKNPMSDEDLEGKFLSLAQGLLSEAQNKSFAGPLVESSTQST